MWQSPLNNEMEPGIKAISPHRLPPQNLEAEQCVLGAVLLQNGALLKVIEILTEKDFYREAHQKIYSALLTLLDRNEPQDLITIINLLKERHQLDEVGGPAYLAGLTDNVPATANIVHYAQIVRKKSILRQLISVNTEIAARCYEEQDDIDELLNEVEQTIFEISRAKSSQSIHPLNSVIKNTFKTVVSLFERKELITGVPTGFDDFDKMTAGLQSSDLIIIAGRPSMGKTALALNMAQKIAIQHTTPVAIFSLEMSKEQLGMRLLCSESKVDAHQLRTGFFNDSDWPKLTQAAGRLSSAPVFIDDTPSISVLEVRAKARRLKTEHNLGLIIVDYLQLMRGRDRVDQRNREQEISEISRSLKAMAKELYIPVIALSQLNRSLENRSDRRPQLSDLRESGAIEQDADLICFIYRDEVYNKKEDNPYRGIAELIIGKQRNGPTGTIKLTFLAKYSTFENYAPDHQLQNLAGRT